MLPDDIKPEDIHFTLKEMLSSIRELNRRIDELKIIYRQPSCGGEIKDFIKDRMWKLYSTKFCIIYSIYDLRMNVIKTFSNESNDENFKKIFSIENLSKELRNL
jgi:hypothetical protein